MATSGTVGTTTLDNAKVLEHALRRVGFPVARQTPEVVETALDSLFLLLLSLSNRGLNLWCLERDFLGLATGQKTYPLPNGTLDITNVIYCQPTRATGTDTVAATSVTTDLTDAASIYRVGLKFDTITAAETITVASSSDNITYTPHLVLTKSDWATGAWYWLDLDPYATARYWRVSAVGSISITEFFLASALYEIPLAPYNRDDYMALNNKYTAGNPSSCYFFEKKIPPQVTLWPVPTTDYVHLALGRQRQPQDVGGLINDLEVPVRWIEGMIWQLAARLVFELDGVDPARAELVLKQAQEITIDAEASESDGAPLMIAPGIAGYTR